VERFYCTGPPCPTAPPAPPPAFPKKAKEDTVPPRDLDALGAPAPVLVTYSSTDTVSTGKCAIATQGLAVIVRVPAYICPTCSELLPGAFGKAFAHCDRQAYFRSLIGVPCCTADSNTHQSEPIVSISDHDAAALKEIPESITIEAEGSDIDSTSIESSDESDEDE
jgi:hypothetical protein